MNRRNTVGNKSKHDARKGSQTFCCALWPPLQRKTTFLRSLLEDRKPPSSHVTSQECVESLYVTNAKQEKASLALCWLDREQTMLCGVSGFCYKFRHFHGNNAGRVDTVSAVSSLSSVSALSIIFMVMGDTAIAL